MSLEYKNYIGGHWHKSSEPVEIKNPYSGEVVGTAWNATALDVETAITSAATAFQQTKRLPAWRRAEILSKIIDGIVSNKQHIARLLTLESGKPIKYAKVEVERAILTFTDALEESKRIRGEWLPLDNDASTTGRSAIVRRFPIGAISAITPFNFPLNLVVHKIAPAIACGASIVVKPSPQAPLSALNLARIISSADPPSGMVNILACSNETAKPLITDERIKVLTFTGSATVGWHLKSIAGKKKVILELGGNAGAIVHHDADLDYAVQRCVIGAFAYSGQICISLQRIYVHTKIFDDFLNKFLQHTKLLKIGNPLEESTDIGPMISSSAAQRAMEMIEEAKLSGAKVLIGGNCSNAVMEPTVLTATRPDLRICREEAFAPLVMIEKYSDINTAITAINNSEYGLQAGIFTRDINHIFHSYEELEVGALIVNDVPTFRADPMPYGGWKNSGIGREGVRYAINEYTDLKALVFKF